MKVNKIQQGIKMETPILTIGRIFKVPHAYQTDTLLVYWNGLMVDKAEITLRIDDTFHLASSVDFRQGEDSLQCVYLPL